MYLGNQILRCNCYGCFLLVVWDRKPIFEFPPFPLIHRCLKKITANEAVGVIIALMWPTQTYFPGLMSLLIRPPRLLPRKESLLRLPLLYWGFVQSQVRPILQAYVLSVRQITVNIESGVSP